MKETIIEGLFYDNEGNIYSYNDGYILKKQHLRQKQLWLKHKNKCPRFLYIQCLRLYMLVEFNEPGILSCAIKDAKSIMDNKRKIQLEEDANKIGYSLIKR